MRKIIIFLLPAIFLSCGDSRTVKGGVYEVPEEAGDSDTTEDVWMADQLPADTVVADPGDSMVPGDGDQPGEETPEDGDAEVYPPDEEVQQGNAYGYDKITICHKGKTIEVPLPALEAHLKHGDYEGACLD